MTRSRLLAVPAALTALTVMASASAFAATPAKHATNAAKTLHISLDRETPDTANALRLAKALGSGFTEQGVLAAMRAVAARHPATQAAYQADLATALKVSPARLTSALKGLEHASGPTGEGRDGTSTDNESPGAYTTSAHVVGRARPGPACACRTHRRPCLLPPGTGHQNGSRRTATRSPCDGQKSASRP